MRTKVRIQSTFAMLKRWLGTTREAADGDRGGGWRQSPVGTRRRRDRGQDRRYQGRDPRACHATYHKNFILFDKKFIYQPIFTIFMKRFLDIIFLKFGSARYSIVVQYNSYELRWSIPIRIKMAKNVFMQGKSTGIQSRKREAGGRLSRPPSAAIVWS